MPINYKPHLNNYIHFNNVSLITYNNLITFDEILVFHQKLLMHEIFYNFIGKIVKKFHAKINTTFVPKIFECFNKNIISRTLETIYVKR